MTIFWYSPYGLFIELLGFPMISSDRAQNRNSPLFPGIFGF
ncbi:hypothetical protein [Coleofasciculus sp. FACHB-712]|nr:hypothetical protein [Coleofasciculus sp. FACHB-712]